MTNKQADEFLERFMTAATAFISATGTEAEEIEVMGFSKGFHVALGCMIYHPEWARAAFELLEDGMDNTEHIMGIFVKNLPIEMEIEG